MSSEWNELWIITGEREHGAEIIDTQGHFLSGPPSRQALFFSYVICLIS